MTTEVTTDLAACLALVSEATPGELHAECVDGTWAVARELSTIGGAGFAVDCECWKEIDAQATASAVNLIRTHGATLQRALALLAAVESGEWKCVPVAATEAMLRAGVEGVYGPATYKCVNRSGTELYEQEADSNYSAMLAAAPAAPGVEG